MELLWQCFRIRFEVKLPLKRVLCLEDTEATTKTALLTFRRLCCAYATASRDFIMNGLPQCNSAQHVSTCNSRSKHN